ncbi:MAG TPA: hypothetical protein VG826_17060 [Pirellulales bacterium]|nr:hypothetical protein [Pirellulales bacterium]
MIWPNLRNLSIVLTFWLLTPAAAYACPFCNAQTKTLSEELDSSDAVVVAKLVKGPSKEAIAAGDANAESLFEIVQVVKGAEILGKTRQIRVLYFGQQPAGTQFLVFGIDPKKVQWATPNALSPRAVKYVLQLTKLPKNGADRLAFFQEYLEDPESLLATDAYDEFARAPYAEVKELKDRMHQDRLLGWIKNPDVPASRRRLYLTMLGVCGGPDDVGVLEEMIKSTDRQVRTALDALVACYLVLKGPDGMALVEDLFLKNKEAEYTDTYAAIMALRFLGQETTAVPKTRLLVGLRAMLDRPQLADLVIPDLARWQDWSAMDKLVELFKTADEESSWVKVPVVNYLRACPKPEAKVYLEELAKLDPESVKRANSFFPFGGVAASSGNDTSSSGGTEKAGASGSTAKQPLVPAPDTSSPKKEDGGEPSKGAGASGSAGKGKSPEPGKTSASDPVPVVPALIGAVVAMADEQNSAAEESPSAAKETSVAKQATKTENKGTTQVATRLSSPIATRSDLAASKQPAANRWQVVSVTLGAAVAVFGLMFTILRGK